MTDLTSPPPAEDDDRPVLTTRQGHPIADNQNTRTVGNRGPATLENYQLLEKTAHFDRERIPERVVHARGATAFGTFTTTGTLGDTGRPLAELTRAKLFDAPGKVCEVALRFSTVAGGRDSSEAVRDPRGFAVKFYTEDGNWDLVGNDLAVFFIRDAIKFPDFIHSQKPDPVTFERQIANRVFDFISQTPESLHMCSMLFGPRGIPASFRTMQGFGVNTYKWVNAPGETKLVKYHWHPKQGVKSMTAEDAAAVQAEEIGAHTKDLYGAIARGEFPEWELFVQLADDHEHPELNFDVLDDTKTWPENDFPLHKIGELQLNRAPRNFFNESEQIAFGTGVLVDGLDFSEDKMLVGRTFSYSDTQRHRIGPNYLQLPVNAPKAAEVRTNQRDGQMNYGQDEGHENLTVNYEPSTLGGLREADRPGPRMQGPTYDAQLVREHIERTNDYEQPGQRFQLSEPWEQDDLVANLTGQLEQCDRHIQERMVWHLFLCDDELGQRVGDGLGISADDVRQLKPLASQGWGPDEQNRLDNLGKNGVRDVAGLVMTHCVPNEHVAVADGDREFIGGAA